MRTHLDLDNTLLEEVITLGAFPTKRAAVMTALEELAKRFKRRELAAMRGKVAWEGDLERWRASRSGCRTETPRLSCAENQRRHAHRGGFSSPRRRAMVSTPRLARSASWRFPLGKQFSLTTADNHKLGAYRADPAGKPKGGIVVVQEIFGVNHHIRAVCDRLAALGYVAVAPAIFDRFVRDFECGYTPDEIAHARSYLGNLDWDKMMLDVSAAQADIKGAGPLGVIGFCMGGTAAFLAACRLPGFAASVSFYGGMIGKFADEKPKCPMQMHFGEKDEGIPMDVVDAIKAKQPQAEVYVYPGAPHGFYCDERASYRKESGDLAWSRTQEFFSKHMK